MHVLAALLSALATVAAPALAAAADRQLTLEEAESLAQQNNPSLSAHDARVQSAELLARSMRSRMLPSILITDEYQHWDSTVISTLTLGSASSDFTVRNQDTHSFSATASQPLLGLLRQGYEYRSAQKSAEATAAQGRIVAASVRQGVRVAFLRYFEARALAEIARQSEKELNEHVTMARAKVDLGVLTNADLLRVQVAASSALQQQMVANTQAEVARTSILIAVGMSPDQAVELVEPAALVRAAHSEALTYQPAVQRALAARPELLTAQLNIEAANHQQRGRLLMLLPEINLVGGYLRNDGQLLYATNAGFVGVRSSWQIWDCGATWFNYQAARQLTRAAQQEHLAVQRQIQAEVATRLAESRAARSAVSLAEQSIASAAEAYRVTVALLQAGAATTTDLLAAQSALSQARLSLIRAQYQRALAHIEIEHAVASR